MSSYPTGIKNCKNFKKIKKNKKNTIMASFHAKIGWERPRKIENKKKSFRWVLTRPGIENSKKIAKKLKNPIMASFWSQNRLGKAEKERK